MNDSGSPSTMLEAALAYARHGWRVVPLHSPAETATGCDCRRAACDKPGKHPRIVDWPNRATTDEATIRTFWSTYPSANVGIATGAASGIVVVDIDAHSNGFESLTQLEETHGSLPRAPRVRTGGGGLHIYFAHPGGHVANSVQRVAPGIDIRADAGLVVAPPSRHVSGATYEWE